MSNYQCPIGIHCSDYPFANLSSEGIDLPWLPPRGQYWTAVGYCCDGAQKTAWSGESQTAANSSLDNVLATACPNCDTDTLKFCADASCPDGTLLTTKCVPTSQADADALAAIAAAAMLPYCNPPSTLYEATCACPDGVTDPHTVYSNISTTVAEADCAVIPKTCAGACNTEQCCSSTSSDGTTVYCCIAAGTVCASNLAIANADAHNQICATVQTTNAHLSSLPLFWCLENVFSEIVTLTGVSGTNLQWSLTDNGPPSGLVLTKLTENTVLLQTTPATPGSFIFTIRVVLSPTCYVERLYTLTVFGFTTDPNLPTGDVGVEYTAQIVADGGSGNYLFTITDGDLPDGLGLSPTGFITGTPTMAETALFTVTVQDLVTPSMECSLQFEIDVGSVLLSYWKCDDSPGGNITSLHNEVSGMPAYAAITFFGISMPGKIGTAVDTLKRAFQTGHQAAYDIGLLDSFTARMWFNLAANTGGLTDAVFSCYPVTITLEDDGIASSWFELEVLTTAGAKTVATAPFSYGTFHRVAIWFENGVGIGIQLDNDAPVTLAFTEHTRSSVTGTVNMVIWRSNVTDLTTDEIGMWNRKLTATELLSDWNLGNGETYPDVPL